jgi:hypothetical protein
LVSLSYFEIVASADLASADLALADLALAAGPFVDGKLAADLAAEGTLVAD